LPLKSSLMRLFRYRIGIVGNLLMEVDKCREMEWKVEER
jgi:hypothetical protein